MSFDTYAGEGDPHVKARVALTCISIETHVMDRIAVGEEGIGQRLGAYLQ